MTEILDRLKMLQDVLAEKYEIEAKVEELPQTLDVRTASLERFKKEYIDKNEEYKAEKAKVALLRANLENAEKLRESGEKGMDSIETHREYEVLEKQISEAKEQEAEFRKELQKEEKILSELDDRLREHENLIASTEKDVNEERESLDRQMSDYRAGIDALAAQEAEMSAGIEAETIFKFQRIIQRNRKGIVAVRGNVCDGCHMILSAQFANEVRKGERILFCPYCSRILYYEETEGDDSSYFTVGDAGSLADLEEEDGDGEYRDLDEDAGYDGDDEAGGEREEEGSAPDYGE